MANPTDRLKALREFVAHLSSGPLKQADEPVFRRLLSDCWEDIEGSNETSMSIFKIHRAENIIIDRPNIFTFDIERHGATVMGSIYAHVYHWEIDLDKGSAACDYYNPKRIQIGKKDAPLKVRPIAEKVAKEILGFDKSSKNLQWKSDSKVRVLTSVLIPETVSQTTIARRKRFRNCLEEILLSNGWEKTRQYNVYEKC